MFNNGMMMPSLADIAAVTGNRNGNGWGDCGAWWIIVILFALWGGFGCDGNGFGGFGGRAMVPVLPARQMSSVGLTTRA